MKKLTLGALTLCLLLLTACKSAAPVETATETPTPDPAPSQVVETPAVQESAPVSPTPSQGAPEFPQFLVDFDLPRADALVTGGSMQFITCWLTEEELSGLKEVLTMDSWWVADDVPAMGVESNYALYDEDGHSLLITGWDDDKCLVLAKEDSESYLYYALPSVLEAFEAYLAPKNFLPDFVRYFGFDQIEVNRTPNEDGEGYKDFDVYLLNNAQILSFLAALAPDTWTVATGDELAVMYTEALRASDQEGNELNLAPWDEEKCLVNCFFADGSATVRYWAPASILQKAQKLVTGLTSLGVINTTAAYYYDLFWADPGFDALLALTAPYDGRPPESITDDQIAAYAFTSLETDELATHTMDWLTKKHFGRVMDSYDTSMSQTLPSGRIAATGWDIGGSCHLVLTGTPDEDEHGNITASFLLYQIEESAWIDGTLAPALLNHAREYMLTGRVSEYPEPQKISVTFRIETEQRNGIWEEYLVYDSLYFEA